MTEPSESTKLEGLHGFAEYAGSGKLKGKNALITGGEYVQQVHRNKLTQLIISQFWDWTVSCYSNGQGGCRYYYRLFALRTARRRDNQKLC